MASRMPPPHRRARPARGSPNGGRAWSSRLGWGSEGSGGPRSPGVAGSRGGGVRTVASGLPRRAQDAGAGVRLGERQRTARDHRDRGGHQREDLAAVPVQLVEAERQRVVDRVERHARVQRAGPPAHEAQHEPEEAERDQVLEPRPSRCGRGRTGSRSRPPPPRSRCRGRATLMCHRRSAPKMKPRKKNSSAIGATTHTNTAGADQRRRARADAEVLGQLVAAVELDERLVDRGHDVVADTRRPGTRRCRATARSGGSRSPRVAAGRSREAKYSAVTHEPEVEHDVADQVDRRRGAATTPRPPRCRRRPRSRARPPRARRGPPPAPSRAGHGGSSGAIGAARSARGGGGTGSAEVSCGGGTLDISGRDFRAAARSPSRQARPGSRSSARRRPRGRRPGGSAPARSRPRARRRRPRRGCRRHGSRRPGPRRPGASACSKIAGAGLRAPAPAEVTIPSSSGSSSSARRTPCSDTSQLLTTTSRCPRERAASSAGRASGNAVKRSEASSASTSGSSSSRRGARAAPSAAPRRSAAGAPEAGLVAAVVEMGPVIGDLGRDRPRRLALADLEPEPLGELDPEPRGGRLERDERAERVEQDRGRWAAVAAHARRRVWHRGPSERQAGPAPAGQDRKRQAERAC